MKKYVTSTRRYLEKEELEYKENIQEELIKLYNPVAYEYEKQILNFDISSYNNSIICEYSKNCLSLQYSRNKARNLFKNYIEKTNTKYDFVFYNRFDPFSLPSLKIKNLHKSKVHASNYHLPRKIFDSSSMIIPQDIYIKWFNIYDELEKITNDNMINEYYKITGEKFRLNDEELVTSKYLYEFKNFDNISQEYYWV
jgi:hypothetical protein